MRFTLTIDADGAAFADAPHTEVVRLLRLAADDIEEACGFVHPPHALRDINGNTCCEWEVTDDDEVALPSHMTPAWWREQSEDMLRILSKRGVRVDFPAVAQAAEAEKRRRLAIPRA